MKVIVVDEVVDEMVTELFLKEKSNDLDVQGECL